MPNTRVASYHEPFSGFWSSQTTEVGVHPLSRQLDTVRIEPDLGPGWATSVEQTALDLCRDRPAWRITDEARTEMVRRLADRIDWDLIDEIAETTRGVKTLHRLRTMLDRPPS